MSDLGRDSYQSLSDVDGFECSYLATDDDDLCPQNSRFNPTGMARIRRYAFALLVGAALLACSVLFLLESFLFVSLSRSNLCETQESTSCFEREPGVVNGSDGSREMDVTPLGGEPERVVAYAGWNETPPPGTEVVLERWEGDEVAYVYVPGNGSRYKTNGAPDRENPAVFAVIFAVLAVALPVHIVRRRSAL